MSMIAHLIMFVFKFLYLYSEGAGMTEDGIGTGIVIQAKPSIQFTLATFRPDTNVHCQSV